MFHTDSDPPAPNRPATLDRIQALYDDGQLLDAWQAAQALGPLQCWTGPQARILAARLAWQLSANRLGDAVMLRTWRAHGEHPQVKLYGAMALYSTRGLLDTLDFLNVSGLLDLESQTGWDALAYSAWLHASLRDFETADALIARALAASGTAWIWSQQAAIHEIADRYEPALAAARHAMTLDPRLRAPVQYTARLLSLVERDEQAIELLRDAMGRLQSPRIAAMLADLEFEAGQFNEALATLERYDALTPIKDKNIVVWLAARRCDIHHRLGDAPRALEQARLSNTGFYKQIAQRLEQAEPGAPRVQLPVGFVRQHHLTCAPATMAALSRYWQRPTDHQELAESICYDGTPHHSQRHWASRNGWHVREFTVTWDAARALIDAGIPFTLSTVHPGSAHLQAVIGYDAARATLLIRDPYERVHTEFAQQSFFEGYSATGPRGMAMAPAGEAARLDAIALPETALHDLAYAVQDALVAHDRARAVASCAELTALASGHRIEIGARRSLASYDNDLPGELRVTEELLAAHPLDVNLRLCKAALLRQLAPHEDYLAYVRAQCEGPAPHTLLQLRLARILLDDARQHDEALRILRQLARRWSKSDIVSALADAHWEGARYARAVELYRFASTLDATNEDQARSYFRAARMVRGEERALAYLRHRIERLGALSAQPAVTLHECLDELDRAAEARVVLEQALSAHPDDAALLLFAARSAAAAGDHERADGYLAHARSRSHEADWLRTAARIHQMRGELARALQDWQQVAAAQPLDMAAHRAIAGLQHEINGRAAAVQWLYAAADRFPHHQGLCELLAEWLDEAPLPNQEAALLRLLELHPLNAWAQRQLGLILAKQRRFDQAHARMVTARELMPNSVAWHNVQGDIFLLEGRREQAREHYRGALRLSVDAEHPLNALLHACINIEERRTELAFVLEEMKRQVIYGDSLLAYQSLARDTLTPEVLAQQLDQACAARPDLWHSWVACMRQCVERQQYERARALCDQALARFPMLPRMHVERADIARMAGNRQDERAALREALRLSPGWSLAARRLADALEAEGDFTTSRAVIEAALRHSPADAVLRGYLGQALWQLGERDAATEQLVQSVTLDPGYQWAWRTLKEYTTEQGQANAAIELARRLSTQRAGELRLWLALARIGDEEHERMAALDQALALAPLSLPANELKLDLLIQFKRHDEALALVDAGAWGAHPPLALLAKACRVLAARGDLPAAITRMQNVLAADPNHHQGWELLADWHCEREDWPAYLTATREMHRILPNDARSLGYLADALRKTEPNTDVRPYLRRAQHLSPDYAFAGQTLFDLELEAGDFDAAEAALRILCAHVSTAYTRWREIRLAVRRGQHKTALDLYWRMWALRDDDIEPFRDALELLVGAGWGDDAQRVIDRVVLEPGVNPLAGTLWVQRRTPRVFPLQRFDGFEQVLANGQAGQLAAQELLEHYRLKKNVRALRRLVHLHGPVIARDDTSYGLMGYALVSVNRPRDAAAWFARWRDHPGAPAWALLNHVSALRDIGLDREANEVGRHALTLAHDHSSSMHAVWLAFDAAMAGRPAEAARLLADLDQSSLNVFYRFVCRLTQALEHVGAETTRLSDAGHAHAVTTLRGLQYLLPSYRSELALRRSTNRVLWRIARARTQRPVAQLGVWLYLVLMVLN